MNKDNEPKIVPAGSVGPKCRELFAYLVTSVLMRNHQPDLYSLGLNMRTDCDSVIRMLDTLQKFGLIQYEFRPSLHVNIPKRGPQLRFEGEVT